MSVFNRLFKIGEAETHSMIDKLEDPIKLTEQGIRDLKKSLDKSLISLAEVKAMAIRAKSDYESNKSRAESYKRKAIELLTKVKNSELAADEGDRLATEALKKKDSLDDAMQINLQEKERFEKQVDQLDSNIKKLRSDISKYENELKTLKARVRVSESTTHINKQMARIDTSGTVAMLERMKDKVTQQEALAEAYGTISSENRTLDEEINTALDDSSEKASEKLNALKAKLEIK